MNSHELEPTQIILVDDEAQVRQSLSQALEIKGYQVLALDSAEAAIAKITRELNGVVISDYHMPGKNGIELLRQINAMDAEIPVIILTGHADVEVAVEAMRSGAYDFLEKPFSMQRLSEKVARAAEKRQLRLENRQLKLEVGSSRRASP
ncbi:MAG: sigma-54-dependent Fis family transcriptional regulator, partial [Cellvibrionaceae bacterium]|nr:sigma-54-dependent Fis family transcriptional regulator [Cellvibrionaceae bacterium]